MADLTLDQIRKAVREEVHEQLETVEDRLNVRLDALSSNIAAHRKETQVGFSGVAEDISEMVNGIADYIDQHIEKRIKKLEDQLQLPS